MLLLGKYDLAPNRAAVRGSNLLIFGNLVLIMVDLYKLNFRNREIRLIENIISRDLPVYALWVIVVAFGFSFLFGFRLSINLRE